MMSVFTRRRWIIWQKITVLPAPVGRTRVASPLGSCLYVSNARRTHSSWYGLRVRCAPADEAAVIVSLCMHWDLLPTSQWDPHMLPLYVGNSVRERLPWSGRTQRPGTACRGSLAAEWMLL